MELSPKGIPILDFSAAINGHTGAQLTTLANHMSNACQTVGCFYIKNHGVDHELIDTMRRDFRYFFAQPLEYKNKFLSNEKGWMGNGYYPFQTMNTHANMGRMNQPDDQMEMLTFFCPTKSKYASPNNKYPKDPADFKENVLKYYTTLKGVAMAIMKVMGIAANAPDEDIFYRNSHNGPHSITGNFYPSYSIPDPSQGAWGPAHIDSGPMAIIALDPLCPNSLRVKNAEGKWIFLYNVGPMTSFLHQNIVSNGLKLQLKMVCFRIDYASAFFLDFIWMQSSRVCPHVENQSMNLSRFKNSLCRTQICFTKCRHYK